MKSIITNIVASPVTALAITALSVLFPLVSPSLNEWFAYAFGGSLLAYFTFLSGIILVEKKKATTWKEQMKFSAVYEKIEHDWQITDKADFYGRYMYVLANIGDTAMQALPYDDVAWHEMPENMEFKTEVVDMGTKKYEIVNSRGSFYENFFNWNGGNKKSYIIFWHQIVAPPLLPNDKITFVKTVYTPETEKTAFTDSGGLAGIPVNIPTKQATIRYICSPNYQFEIIDAVMVFDQAGERHADIERYINPPILNNAKNMVIWELINPKVGFRYNYRYKLIKNNAIN